MARTIRRYREDYSEPIDIKFTDYSLQAGILKGIKYNPPTRLSFMPYASIYTLLFGENHFHITME